jgi:GT2 family glycosyltransferase
MSTPTLGPTALISFVVIAHNEERSLGTALSSILRQRAGDHPYEVVVVDDGSTDTTYAVAADVARNDPQIRLLRLDRNRGRGYARHHGIAAARGEAIATVDADIVLPDDWLARCLAELDSASASAVCGTAVPDGDVAFLYSTFRLRPRVVPHAARITGNNALYRSEIFQHATFDPNLRDGEDVALSEQLQALGVGLRTVPGLVVDHKESKSTAQALRWMFQSGRGASRQLWRYKRVRGPDLAFLLWSALVAVGAWRSARERRLSGLPLLVYTQALAAIHVTRAFHIDPRRAINLVAASEWDSVMLTIYFAGRVSGILHQVSSPHVKMPSL